MRPRTTWMCLLLLTVGACSDDRRIEPGPSPIRRMTRTEYDNTVRDLLGDGSRPGKDFVPELELFGLNNNAEVLVVSDVLVEQWMAAAESLAASAATRLPELLPCDPAAIGEDACAVEFIRGFGLRAWRRPLTDAEVERLYWVYDAGLQDGGLASGIELVIATVLQSPHFLYRIEIGEPVDDAGRVRRLGPWELASRLSYLLWQSMPDDELFAAAASGRLKTRADLEAQARRMLADPRARTMVVDFHAQWLALEEIDHLDKDTNVYPQYTPELRPHLREEIEHFLDHAVWSGAGDLSEIFTASYTFVNRALADVYGLDGPASDDEWVRVDLDPARSAGLLTKPGILATHAKVNQSSPVHRGKFVRERLLCQMLPPPPPDIEIAPPDLDPNLTTRERFDEHRENPFCAGCHVLMDPIGLGFEHFDGLGLWRDDENGLPIDDSGEIFEADIAGPFEGVAELGRKLAKSEQVRACIVKSWFRFGYGRTEADVDAATLDWLTHRFAATGGNVRELLVALTQTDAFMFRTVSDDMGGEK